MTPLKTGYQNVGTWIERRAKVGGDRVALIYGDTHRTYSEFAARVRRLAHGLRVFGVKRADRVVWLGPNHPAFLETLFASASLGAVLAPINHRLEHDAIEAICIDVAPRVVLHGSALTGLRLPSAVSATVLVGSEDRQSEYEQLIASAADGSIDEAVGPDDPCLLPFTSGTTGRPKGVMLSHGNVTWNVINGLSALDVRSDDVTIASVPFFRTGGTGVTVLPVLFNGGTVVIPRSTESDEFLELVEQHRATIGFGNPNLLEGLVRSPRWRTADLSSLRMLVIGGAPIPERLLRASADRHVNVAQGYGLSEAAPVVSMLDPAHALPKVGSVGRPAMFVDIRIVADDGHECAVGEIGELLVRGPNVMTRYWNRPDATGRALDRDDWLHTGDAAHLDADGFLFIVGRVEEAFMSGGQVVHPWLVERVLLQHPSVADVCVLAGDDGVDRPGSGHPERTSTGVVAYVVLADGATALVEPELRALCEAQLAVHARPVLFQWVASLPRNAAGKLVRQMMRGPTASPRLTAERRSNTLTSRSLTHADHQ